MANSYSKQIQDQIKAAAEGTIFISSDFADIADTETIRRNLNRLTQAGMLRRILKGVYEKPKYSKLLDEYVAADPEAVANALARSYALGTVIAVTAALVDAIGLQQAHFLIIAQRPRRHVADFAHLSNRIQSFFCHGRRSFPVF